MIATTLIFLKNRLNDHVQARYDLENDPVSVAPLGSETQNQLMISLINIAEDQRARHQPHQPTGGPVSQPAMHLELHIMISANFPHAYADGLNFISEALAYIQDNPAFTPQNAPALPDGLQQLGLELVNLSFQDQHAIWTSHSAPYRPSVLLKLRGITVEKDAMPNPVEKIRPLTP